MSGTTRWVATRAPAKLNLGLAVLGRREDGYHELATIFQAIGLYDEVEVRRADGVWLEGDDPAGGSGRNLALLAVERLIGAAGVRGGAAVRLTKGIPTAAGLGGASSDAAAALRAGRRRLAPEVDDGVLASLAAGIGSDVPFFLGGGTALGTGRGEELETLPALEAAWFVVLVPEVVIPRKTATLYGALREEDFGDGSAVVEQAARLRGGRGLDAGLLGNAFARPLYGLRPELAALPGVMRRLGAPVVALSGAGPSHYVAMDDPEAAEGLAVKLRGEFRGTAAVFVVRAMAGVPAVVG